MPTLMPTGAYSAVLGGIVIDDRWEQLSHFQTIFGDSGIRQTMDGPARNEQVSGSSPLAGSSFFSDSPYKRNAL